MEKEYKIRTIRNKQKIKNLLLHGKRYKTANLKFYYDKNGCQNSMLEYLISIPKKNIKLAVTRNYLKRITREVINTNKKGLSEVDTKTIFIVVFNNDRKIKYFNLEEEILTFIRRIKE